MKKSLLVLIGLFSILMVQCCDNDCHSESTEDKSLDVGKTVVMGDDIFTIVEYDPGSNHYKLHNGVWVSADKFHPQ